MIINACFVRMIRKNDVEIGYEIEFWEIHNSKIGKLMPKLIIVYNSEILCLDSWIRSFLPKPDNKIIIYL
jgi:hypothetical protein